MSMRNQFVLTLQDLLVKDKRVVLLLGDIGVFGFRHAFEAFPERVYNIGILEQATISLAAGLALEGFIPVVHTIAPFIVERGLEQLKIDFGYQALGGNFVSVGGSYDYAGLGCTHHCPGDIGILKTVPDMEILVPGNARELDTLLNSVYASPFPTYFRLSERENEAVQDVSYGRANVVKKGKKATIIAVGPTLDAVLHAAADYDVTVLYYTTLQPFDTQTLRENCTGGKVLLCEPYYAGGLVAEIMQALAPRPVSVACIGVPHQFLLHYGSAAEHDQAVGLTAQNISSQIARLIYE